MSDSYMEMIYIDSDGNARQTGVGCAMKTNALTWKAFQAAKKRGVPFEQATFLLDYHKPNGDLADTVALTIKAFEEISGEKYRGDKYYRKYDEEYWRKARKEHRSAA